MEKSIRLERIYVKKLFNRFTYNIDLENGNDIAILIAPNGCGKTTILRMINFIFSPSLPAYKYIRKLPFETFQCTLSNGNCIGLEKKSKRNKKRESNVDRNLLSSLSGVEDEYSYDEEKSLIMFINEGEKKYPLDLSNEVEDGIESVFDITDSDRSFLIKYKRNTEFVSIGLSTYVSWGSDLEKTGLCVAVDNEKVSHHALQLVIDDNVIAINRLHHF